MKCLCYKCGYDWNYKGIQRGKSNLSCPRCSYRLRADKAIIEDLHTKQEKLHDLPLELHKRPEKVHTYIHKKKKLHNFIEVEKGIFVDRKIEKQFREARRPTTNEVTHRILPLEPPGEELKQDVVEEPEKVFTNMSDFNMEILRKSFESENLYPKTSFKILSSSLPSSVQKAIH